MKTRQYGEWKLGNALGEGGQGNVYKTKDKSGAARAIKVVKIDGNDKKKIARIKQEVNLIKKLKDASNVVKLYDDNVDDLDENAEGSQHAYYVMDYARFGSLRDNDFYLQDIENSLRIFKEILAGVNAAHKQGIVHRDLKPENILLFPTQKNIVVADFGLGKLAVEQKGVTETNEVLGARFFMAPEQYKEPSKATVRSDIYSLGKILYYMLTGEGEVFREEIGNLSDKFMGSNPYLPLIQELLLNKMVVTDPKKRFNNTSEIINVVDDILEKVSHNSKRIIRKSASDVSFYDLLIGSERRKEFVDDFSKDLSLNMQAIEWVVEELVEDGKDTLLEKLKSDIYASNSNGKPKAILDALFDYFEKPEDLEKKANGRYSFPAYYLARYFENVDAHEEAHKYIDQGLNKETDQSILLRYLLLFSRICTKCTCKLPHDFNKRLVTLLQSTQDKEMKAKLYKMLGEHYIKTDDKKQGLMYLEAYLSLKPYDNDSRFKCAYEYSNIDMPSLALQHYTIYEKSAKKNDTSASNNIGVIYDNNNAPIKAMEQYERAFGNGETLAGSNIASLYLRIGKVEEAQKILREIIAEHPDGKYDKRVDRVLGEIPTDLDNEDEVEKKLLSRGATLSHHNIDFLQALTSSPMTWEGYWKIDEGPVVEITSEQGVLAFFDHPKKESQIKAHFEGNTATITNFKFKLTTYEAGRLYLDSNDSIKGYIQNNDSSYQEVNAQRISDIQKYDSDHQSLLTSLADTYKNLRGTS